MARGGVFVSERQKQEDKGNCYNDMRDAGKTGYGGIGCRAKGGCRYLGDAADIQHNHHERKPDIIGIP